MAQTKPSTEGFAEVFRKLWNEMTPELQREVLSIMLPEERLAGLDEAHAVLALPLKTLRGLSTEYIDSLPQDVQDEIKRRLASS